MKDQFVIACVDRPSDAPTLLEWTKRMGECLRHKGVMALNVSPEGKNEWLSTLDVPYVGLKGEWSDAIEGLPTAFGGILAIVAVDPTAPRASLAHPRTLLRQFHNCKIAYLCVPVGKPFDVASAALTLTHRREGKEKLVWASYLARFCGSALTIAHPCYRDEGLQQLFDNNVRFANKFFPPIGVDYALHPLGRTAHVDLSTLEQCHPSLLVAMTSDVRERDVIDWFSPRPEQRLLLHPSHTPLLFLNPRDDLYILCD